MTRSIVRVDDEPAVLVAGDGEPVTLTYTNYRGETAKRTITPKHVYFGSTEWHPEPQWLLCAYDHDKKADRDFAIKDFGAQAEPAAIRNEAEGDWHDLETHFKDWRMALELVRETAECDPPIDDKAYWQHQIDVLDRVIPAAIRALQTAPASLDAETRQVLDTFAAVLDEYDPTEEADETPATLVVGSVTNYDLTLGDFRAARELLGRR